MAPNPNGTIVTRIPVIYELGLGDYYGTGHVTMKLRFYDNEYKRVQNAVTGNPGFSSPPGLPMQAHFQIPPYIVRVLRKQRNTQTIGNPNQLWVSYSRFNDSTYFEKNDNYFDSWYGKDIGVPLTPYFFYYNLAGNGPYTWDWNYLAQFDGFTDPQNNEHTVYFDSYGRGNLSGGGAVRAQAVRRYSNNNTGAYAESYLDSIQHNNSFDYGGYLVCLIRTSITNQNYDVNNQTDITGYAGRISCAYTYRMPPAPILNYNSSTDVVSFTFNTYGSVNLTYQGVPYISDRYNYPPNFEVTTTGSFNNYSYRSYGGSISRNDIVWADNVTTSSTISNIRSYVNQYDKTINIRGAFEFDWSYTNNSSSGNYVIAYSSANFNGVDNWNKIFGLNYYLYYNNSGVNSNFASSNILNNGQKNQFQTTSNTYSVASFYSSITFNTELVNINNQYLFRSYWTETQGINLTSNVLSYPYTLRLYKKSTTDTSSDMSYKYRLGAITPYNYVNQNITGLGVSTNWNNFYMNIYTDKNGNIWYGGPPTSGFTGWTASEVEGAYIMVLQRNFTATSTSSINIALQGSYVINVPTAHLTYIVSPTTGDITNYYMTDSVFYNDATNIWTVKPLIKNQAYKAAPSNRFTDLTNITGPTANITDIDDVYADETKYNTFTFSVLNNNGILVNKSYTFNGDNYSADQNSYLPTRVYAGAGRAYQPPFYDTSKNLITEYPGIDWSTFQSVTLDLTKPIQFQYINVGGIDNCLFLATSTGQSGYTYNATLLGGSTLTLHNTKLKGKTETDSIGFTMDNSVKGKVVNSYYLNGVLFPSNLVISTNKYFYPPFFDSEGKILDNYGGIDINTGASVTIDLQKPLTFYNLNGSVGILCYNSGGSNTATFPLGAAIYTLNTYKSKWVFFQRNGNPGSLLNNNFMYIRKDAYSNNQLVNLNDLPLTFTPPFFNNQGNYLHTYPGQDFNGNPVTIDLTKQLIFGNSGGSIFIDAFDTNGNICSFSPNSYIELISEGYYSNAGVIANNVTNYFNVGSSGFADNLIYYGYYNVTNLTNQPGSSTPYTTNNLLIYPQPLVLNTELVNINGQYNFRSQWEEIYVDYLSTDYTGSAYSLRLYKKDNNSTGNVRDTYKPVNNYQFISITDTGLELATNWSSTTPYTMDVYTDVNAQISYNSPPGSFTGWSLNEAYFMVLQRNFTNSTSDPLLLQNQGCYIINMPAPSLTYSVDQFTGDINEYTTLQSKVYADSTNIWNINNIIKDQTYNVSPTDYNIKLPNITNDFAKISDIEDAYVDTPIYNNIEFSIQSGSNAGYLVNGNYLFDNKYYTANTTEGPYNVTSRPRVYYPPFYDTNKNVITEITGFIYGTTTPTTIDLTKPIKFTYIGPSPNITFQATSIGQTGNTYNATFGGGQSVTLYTIKLNGQVKTNSISFTMDGSTRSQLANSPGSYYLNGQLYPSSLVFAYQKTFFPPFLDNEGRLLEDFSGIDINTGQNADISLKNPIIFYNLSNNVAVKCADNSGNFNLTFNLNANISLNPYEVKKVYIGMDSNSNNLASFAIRLDPYNNDDIDFPRPITLTPPFFDNSGNYLQTYPGQDKNGNHVTIDMTKQIMLPSDINEMIAFDTSGNICNFERGTFTVLIINGGRFSNAGLITNRVINYFNVGTTFVENLVDYFNPNLNYGTHLITSISGQEETFYDKTTTNSIIVYPQPVDFNTEFIKIGNEYILHSYWEDIYQQYLTTYLTNSPYSLRLYKKVTYSTDSIEKSYLSGPVNNYQYIDILNSGLNISKTFGTNTPPTIHVYTDTNGNIWYNSPPVSDASFTGWTQNEIENAWLGVLQRNYTPFYTHPLLIENQACYEINVPDPSLSRVNDVDGFMSQVITTIPNHTVYADASNNWNVYEYDTTNTALIPGLTSNPTPTRTEINSAYPLRVGPGAITNRLINNFNVGSSFTELLLSGNINYGYHTITSISGEERTIYDVSTNSVNIYDTRQTNDSAYNLSKVKFTFNTYDVSKVYFDIWFDDPDDTMLRPEAFDINIFKKIQGTGTAVSQWYPGGQLSPYIWQSDANRGVTILRTDVPTELEKYKIDASGTVLKYGQGTPADLSGSFETGGYIVTFRRNFYKGTATEPNAKEPFYTLNSQYVYVPPSQTTTYYTIPILNSSNLTLEDNSQTTERLELTTPIYNSYAPDGSVDINFNVYASFDEASFTPKWQPISLYDVSLNYAYVNVRDLYFDFYGLGNGFFYFEVSYNWVAPSQLSLPIGEIGGIYPTIYSAENNPDLSNVDAPFTYQKLGQTEYVLPNIAITNTIELNLPVDSSFARLNEVKELQAEFIGTDTTRMLAIKWREPNVDNLNTTYTGFPYALRLYKKKKDGYTANDQWYDRDASGTAGVYPYRWIPDYFNPNPNNYTYDGVEISANFFPQITTGNYLYFFADASGTVYYNDYPDNLELQNVKPFTEPGGYILIVQRHYTDLSGDNVFTTFGQYLSFIPFSSTNPWSLDDTEYPIITSNPNPYSSFNPMIDGGAQNLQFHWTLEIPNINYNELVPDQDASGINIVKSIQEPYRNRGKEAFLTSYVTYDFGLKTRPFIERYPLLRINGDPYYTTPSQQYSTNLCSTGVPLDPPEWPRFRPECLDATPEEREAYQMRRKAETLFHVQNRNDMRTNRKNWFSFVAKGYNQKHQTYATQTDKYTNPNTKNYPVVGGGAGLTLPGDCPKKALTAPSYSSDVPGPTVPLTYDPNVPLINYKVFRTYTNSETEYTEKDKN